MEHTTMIWRASGWYVLETDVHYHWHLTIFSWKAVAPMKKFRCLRLSSASRAVILWLTVSTTVKNNDAFARLIIFRNFGIQSRHSNQLSHRDPPQKQAVNTPRPAFFAWTSHLGITQWELDWLHRSEDIQEGGCTCYATGRLAFPYT